MVLNLLSLENIELEDDFIEFIIREDIALERKKLRCQNKEEFVKKWNQLKNLFESIEYYSDVIGCPEEHEQDAINYADELRNGMSIIEYAKILREMKLQEYEVIKAYIQEGLTIQSFYLEGKQKIVKYLKEKYLRELSEKPDETFDAIQYAAKYFITKYFITKYFEGGVSDDRYERLLEEVETKQFRIFSGVQIDLK